MEGRNHSQAAVQIYEDLSSRKFEVFLDTHNIGPGEEVQQSLWRRLFDTDVLVMLETPSYFDSRWTTEEFYKALARKITILRVAWPGVPEHPRYGLVHSLNLGPMDLNADGTLPADVLEHLRLAAERLRSTSLAVRHGALADALEASVKDLGGTIDGVGRHRSITVRLPQGQTLRAVPCPGVPSAELLHQVVCTGETGMPHAIVYDAQGYHRDLKEYLAWLGTRITEVPCFPKENLAWELATVASRR